MSAGVLANWSCQIYLIQGLRVPLQVSVNPRDTTFLTFLPSTYGSSGRLKPQEDDVGENLQDSEETVASSHSAQGLADRREWNTLTSSG